MNGFLQDEFRANASKLHKRIFTIVKSAFPSWAWKQETAIKVSNNKTLFVDICSNTPIKIAIECHGRQHSEYVAHFHGDILAFKKAVARDKEKKEFLIESGYDFVEFYTNENLSDKEVIERVLLKIKEEV
jgi:very-short-patch-repair endonuclease